MGSLWKEIPPGIKPAVAKEILEGLARTKSRPSFIVEMKAKHGLRAVDMTRLLNLYHRYKGEFSGSA